MELVKYFSRSNLPCTDALSRIHQTLTHLADDLILHSPLASSATSHIWRTRGTITIVLLVIWNFTEVVIKMVHRRCIYLPRVIKITRHPHRLSFTSSVVPSDKLPCGVCRKTVDVNYGQFSCNKGCHYSVHSKCGTKSEVWDGKDLAGVTEEEEEVIEPFVRIDEETIQHFSHEHHYLQIHGNGDHEGKICQACIIAITASDRFYSCLKCDFVLHETCACLPRKKDHPLHKHPLTLFHPFSPNPHELVHGYCSNGYFTCNGCHRIGCGFIYKCKEKDCDFQLDARCASLSDPHIHDSHPHDHPLFFNLTQGKCLGCKSLYCSAKYLECIECTSFLGLRCATFPCVAHYKHDKHPLTLCYGEKETTYPQYWCEICEEQLDARDWFYTCNSCSVTLHVKCLLGNNFYFKPNHIIQIFDEKVDIIGNSGASRPVCDGCWRPRCLFSLVFKWQDRSFCTLECFVNSRIEAKGGTAEVLRNKVYVGIIIKWLHLKTVRSVDATKGLDRHHFFFGVLFEVFEDLFAKTGP